jgi:two-component system, NarL family, nitrate/nitrite response regulator NarL
MIRVLVADSDPIVHEGMSAISRAEPGIAIVGYAQDGVEALELVVKTKPHVMLLELRLVRMDGLMVLRGLEARPPRPKVLLFTGSEVCKEFVEAMRLGCAGILSKSSAPGLIAKSIRRVYKGEIWLDADTAAAVVQQVATPAWNHEARPRNSRLSQREKEIIVLIAQGYTNKQLAHKMLITGQTVKHHLRNIFDKLGVSDQLEPAVHAIHNGLHLKAEQQRHAAGRLSDSLSPL